MKNLLVFKGDIIYSISPKEIKTFPESYIIVREGKVESIHKEMPEEYKDCKALDFSGKLIIPGFVDLHIHAPQIYQRGMGLDKKLIDWLQTYTFQEENKFSDPEYAKKAYSYFSDELVRHGTLSACIFATVHKASTEILFDILDKKGIRAYVGKVNMDRNCPEFLMEETASSINETVEIIEKYKDNQFVKPILTPRFVPTCSEALLKGLGKLAGKYNIPVQSHLSENTDEVAWVASLHPNQPSYSHVYKEYGLFGQAPTLMAHCIHLSESEVHLIKSNNVIPVHCPDSNLNLSSGIMPVRKLMESGIKIGMGSDVGGGHCISITKAIERSIQLSKIMSIVEPGLDPITMEEAFFMATKGGGRFFGQTGSFEKGYWFDALVIQDDQLGNSDISLLERLQRFIYIGDDRNITDRFIQGHRLLNP